MTFEKSVKEYLMRCADVGNHHVNTKYTVMQMMVEARAADGKTALLSHGKLRETGQSIEDTSRAKSLETLLKLWNLEEYIPCGEVKTWNTAAARATVSVGSTRPSTN